VLYLKVFTQRNFVAEFYEENISFIRISLINKMCIIKSPFLFIRMPLMAGLSQRRKRPEAIKRE